MTRKIIVLIISLTHTLCMLALWLQVWILFGVVSIEVKCWMLVNYRQQLFQFGLLTEQFFCFVLVDFSVIVRSLKRFDSRHDPRSVWNPGNKKVNLNDIDRIQFVGFFCFDDFELKTSTETLKRKKFSRSWIKHFPTISEFLIKQYEKSAAITRCCCLWQMKT